MNTAGWVATAGLVALSGCGVARTYEARSAYWHTAEAYRDPGLPALLADVRGFLGAGIHGSRLFAPRADARRARPG